MTTKREVKAAGRSITPPDDVVQLKGKRWPVTASDRADAIRKAKTRKWWPLCLNKNSPFPEHGRFWFVVDVNPADFIR